MSTFVTESYLPSDSEAIARARLAAQRVAHADPRVVYLRTTYLPTEETVFHVFEAASAAALIEAMAAAELNVDRVAEAVELAADP